MSENSIANKLVGHGKIKTVNLLHASNVKGKIPIDWCVLCLEIQANLLTICSGTASSHLGVIHVYLGVSVP